MNTFDDIISGRVSLIGVDN